MITALVVQDAFFNDEPTTLEWSEEGGIKWFEEYTESDADECCVDVTIRGNVMIVSHDDGQFVLVTRENDAPYVYNNTLV